MSERKFREYAFHRVDAHDIAANLVIAAALALEQAQPPSGVRIRCPRAAQVDHGSQILLLLQRRIGNGVTVEHFPHIMIEVRCCEFHGMRGHDARVQAVEPAGVRPVRRA